MFAYNRMAACAYALAWAEGRNPMWSNDSAPIGGGDCTNFVSQALFAGGWKMRFGSLEDPVAWYSHTVTREDRSKSWSSANWFCKFLSEGGRARECMLHELLVGDVMQEYGPGRDYPSHTMMVTQVNRGKIYLSYHSTDRRNISIDDFLARTKKGSRYTSWKIFDMYAR